MDEIYEIKPFWRELLDCYFWVLLGSGLAGGLQEVASIFGAQIPSGLALVIFIGGFILALYAAAKVQYDKSVRLAKRLHPKLEICSGTQKIGGRIRIRVRNLSGSTVRFSVKLEQIDPCVIYQIPCYLQITGTPDPHRESEIRGYGEVLVDVLEEGIITAMPDQDWRSIIWFLSAEYPSSAIPIPRRRYDLLVCAFTLSGDGIPAFRRFSVIIESDGTATLTDAGVPVISYDQPLGSHR